MPRGDKSKYTSKQQRQAEHIEEGYEKRGVTREEAERRAWATENKISGGGKKPGGSGRGQAENKESERKGGRLGGMAHKKSTKVAVTTKSAETSSAARKPKPVKKK